MNIFKTLLNLVAPGSGTAVDVVQKVVKQVTGKDDEQEAMKALEEDPQALADVQKQLSMERVAFEEQVTAQLQERIKNADQVNQTMRAELEKGNGFQKYWRPLNGYLLGLTLFINYALPVLVNAMVKVFSEPIVTKKGDLIWRSVEVGVIPEFVFVAWAAVVGVAVQSRGREKLAKLGVNGPSLLQSLMSGLKK